MHTQLREYHTEREDTLAIREHWTLTQYAKQLMTPAGFNLAH